MAIYRMNVHFFYDMEFDVEADSLEEAYALTNEQAQDYPIYATDISYDISPSE